MYTYSYSELLRNDSGCLPRHSAFGDIQLNGRVCLAGSTHHVVVDVIGNSGLVLQNLIIEVEARNMA